MTQTDEVPGVNLVQTRLRLAQEALEANNLLEAQNFFERALLVEGEHLNRARQIRQILKEYSYGIAGQESPNWELAHQALELINSLKLQDEETLAWQRELKLEEAQFWLGREDLDKSFDIFTNLMTNANESRVQDKLRVEISSRVRTHVVERLPERRWLFLRDIIERLKPFRPSADELHDWPETISQILTATDQAQTECGQRLAEGEQSQQQVKAFLEKTVADRGLTISEQGQRLELLTQAQQRYRSLAYAFAIGIVIALAVAFALVILVPGF